MLPAVQNSLNSYTCNVCGAILHLSFIASHIDKYHRYEGLLMDKVCNVNDIRATVTLSSLIVELELKEGYISIYSLLTYFKRRKKLVVMDIPLPKVNENIFENLSMADVTETELRFPSAEELLMNYNYESPPDCNVIKQERETDEESKAEVVNEIKEEFFYEKEQIPLKNSNNEEKLEVQKLLQDNDYERTYEESECEIEEQILFHINDKERTYEENDKERTYEENDKERTYEENDKERTYEENGEKIVEPILLQNNDNERTFEENKKIEQKFPLKNNYYERTIEEYKEKIEINWEEIDYDRKLIESEEPFDFELFEDSNGSFNNSFIGFEKVPCEAYLHSPEEEKTISIAQKESSNNYKISAGFTDQNFSNSPKENKIFNCEKKLKFCGKFQPKIFLKRCDNTYKAKELTCHKNINCFIPKLKKELKCYKGVSLDCLYKHSKKNLRPNANFRFKNCLTPKISSSSWKSIVGCNGKFNCHMCVKSFKNEKTYKKHMQLHISKEMFKCNVCDKTFTFKGNLKQHLGIHTNERPFPCTVCKSAFRQKSALKQHMMIHTGEKPFACNICEATFSYRITLRNHMLIHYNMLFSCNVCKKSFKENENLQTHMLLHSSEKLFTCNFCKRIYKQKSCLKRHKLIHAQKMTNV